MKHGSMIFCTYIVLLILFSAAMVAILVVGGSKVEEKYGNMLQPATGSHKKFCKNCTEKSGTLMCECHNRITDVWKKSTLQNIKSCPRKGNSPIVDSLNGSLLCGKVQRQIEVQGQGQGQRNEQNKLQLQKAQVQMPVGGYVKKCTNCLVGKNKDDGGGLYMICDCPNLYGERKKTDIGPLDKCPTDKNGTPIVYVDKTGVLNC